MKLSARWDDGSLDLELRSPAHRDPRHILTGEVNATASAASIRPASNGRSIQNRRGFQIPEAARRGRIFSTMHSCSPETPSDQLSKKIRLALYLPGRSLIRMHVDRSPARRDPRALACPCFASTRASFSCSAKSTAILAGANLLPGRRRHSPSRCCSAASSMFSPATVHGSAGGIVGVAAAGGLGCVRPVHHRLQRGGRAACRIGWRTAQRQAC